MALKKKPQGKVTMWDVFGFQSGEISQGLSTSPPMTSPGGPLQWWARGFPAASSARVGAGGRVGVFLRAAALLEKKKWFPRTSASLVQNFTAHTLCHGLLNVCSLKQMNLKLK